MSLETKVCESGFRSSSNWVRFLLLLFLLFFFFNSAAQLFGAIWPNVTLALEELYHTVKNRTKHECKGPKKRMWTKRKMRNLELLYLYYDIFFVLAKVQYKIKLSISGVHSTARML